MIDCVLNRTKVRRGSDLPHAKLSEKDVKDIWSLVNQREHYKRQASRLSNGRLAEMFGVHVRTIDRITSGESWTHVAGGE